MNKANALISASSSSSGIDVSGDDSFQDACTICLEPFDSLNPPNITNCKHEYHFHCIFRWSQIKKQCPVCWQHLVSFSLKKMEIACQKTSPAIEKTEEVEDPSNKENTMPTVFLYRDRNRRDQFQITHPIGKSNNGIVEVYKATWSSIFEEVAPNENSHTDQHVSIVAVKCVNRNSQPHIVRNLTDDVKRNSLIPDHPNLIGIIKYFDYKRYYCIAFPLMEHSLRSIMHARFSKGFPEECVVVALKETLNALYSIHSKGHVHLEINAGNIFFSGNTIKLAFSASVYESQDQNQPSSSSPPSYMPMSSICEWAAAPEYPSERFAHKGDVWMIGITAIELAYGGLWVSSKKDLEDKLLKVEAYKELPSRWIDKEEYGNKTLMSKLFKQRKFSKAFQKMVVSCLSWRPQMRPTVEELLAYEVFTECKKDMNYFSRLVGD